MRHSWIIFVCGFSALFAAFVPRQALAAQSRFAAMVIDANTGEVLHDQNADLPRHPASLTKMMTLYLAFEAVEQGRLAFDTRLVVTTAAASVAPSKLELDPGDEIALVDAIKALITKSANDMAVAIAERIAGSEADFVRLMNERARQIGMRSTTFRNASGLPDDAQVTTARDMLTLALHLQDDFPQHYRLFSIRSFEYRGKSYRTHNTLMNSFPGIDGIKTGYTRASGFNLVSSLRRNGKHIVAAVFGGVTASARNAHMRMLLFQALDKASNEKTRQSRPLLLAQPRPAARPALKVAERPAVAPVWKADVKPDTTLAAVQSKPRPAEKAIPRAATTRTTEAAPAPAPVALAEPTILIAKVRQVQVAALAESSDKPAPQTPIQTASVSPTFDFRAFRDAIRAAKSEPAPPAAAPPGEMETVLAKSSEQNAALGRPPSTLGQQLALLTETAPDEAAAATPISLPNPAADDLRARPPSTLDQQAQTLAPAGSQANTSAMAMHLKGPAPETKPARRASRGASGPYAIQIGAFASAAEAERQMTAAKDKAGAILEGHTATAIPNQDTARPLYRARFAGFDQPSASAACLELRRQQIDCFVAKTD